VIGGANKVAAPFSKLYGWYMSLSWAEATSLINGQFIMALNLLHIQMKLQILYQFRISTNSDSPCGWVTRREHLAHDPSSFTSFFGASHAGVFIDAACAYAQRAIGRTFCESPCLDASMRRNWKSHCVSPS